jgi:apolipoprotein N-acyltransferase
VKFTALKVLVALACGSLLFLSCANFDIWPLAWFAWAPVLWICLEKDNKAWFYGFVCGFACHAGGFYWLAPSLRKFTDLPLLAVLPIFSLIIAYQAVASALFCHLLRRLRTHAGVPIVFLAPIVYVAVELVVPCLFVCPIAITQAWVRPVIQIAELTGPLGVSFLIVMCNAAIYEAVLAWRTRSAFPWRRLAVAAGILAACLGFGFLRIHQVAAMRATAPRLKVGVVQANIGIEEKPDPKLSAEHLAVYQRLSGNLEQKGADLVVWPEASYPYVFPRNRSEDWPEGDSRRVRRGFHTPLLFGAHTVGDGSSYPYNSALLLDKDGAVRGLSDKNILIIFGEYVPYFEQVKVLIKWMPRVSNLAHGAEVSVLPLETTHGAVNIGPMICYEDVFASFGRRLARKSPNLLVNLTNDAWFGRTSEPYEHLALSVYRAVEMRLDLVRAANTGVSAFIDSTGRVYARSPVVDPDETPDASPVELLEEVAVQNVQTLYATLGEWFRGLCLLATFFLFLRVRKREGAPVRWGLVAAGAAALLAVIVLFVLVNDPSRIGLTFALLARRVPDAAVSADLEFGAAWRLLLATLLGCIALGLIAPRAPLERALAVVAVWVGPAIAFGTFEDQQGGLFFGALLGALFASFAARLSWRRSHVSQP